MAEALMRHRFGDRFSVFSAGTESTFVKQPAIDVIQELGIDMSIQFSKTIDQLENPQVDIVVTVCNDAKETCPYLPGTKQTIHKAFHDPSSDGATETEKRDAFRNVRDEIDSWLLESFGKTL